MHKIEFLNDATDQIKKLVNSILDSNPTEPSKVKDFITDLENTFEIIQNDPSSGDSIEDTSIENIRRLHLEKYSQIMVIFTENGDTVTVISVIVYWLAT